MESGGGERGRTGAAAGGPLAEVTGAQGLPQRRAKVVGRRRGPKRGSRAEDPVDAAPGSR